MIDYIIKTKIPELLVIKPQIYSDFRGCFLESYRTDIFKSLKLDVNFVQDNISYSRQGVLRGIHYQIRNVQGKLVQVTQGKVFDVAVDLRINSPTFGQWVSQELSEENHLQFWIPPGFGHAFLVMSEKACFQYKTTDYYSPEWERTILWNDPDLDILWPEIGCEKIISEKDRGGKLFKSAEYYL